MSPKPPLGAVVLAGGRSSRMGTPKAELDWFGSPLVYRTASILARIAAPLVVVRAPDQALPDLPEGTLVVADEAEGLGPLQGMAAGMRAVEAVGVDTEAVFVSSTDVPMLHPAFVRSVAAGLEDADVALPVVDGHNHPLSSVYRLSLLAKVEKLLAENRLRPAFVWEDGEVRRLGEGDLAHPESVTNVNTPEEFDAARARPLPLVVVEAFGTVRSRLGVARTDVRAATLAGALEAVGVHKGDDEVLVAINGEQFRSDPRVALVQGDVLALVPAEAGG